MVMSMVFGTRRPGAASESWARAVNSMKAPITPPWRAGRIGLPIRVSRNGNTAVISSPASSTRMPRKRT